MSYKAVLELSSKNQYMATQLERPPKKLRIQHRTNAEKSLALTETINNACGGALDDEVYLKDLFYWNSSGRDGKDSNPPDEWVNLVQGFTNSEKVPFFHALGIAIRKIKDAYENPTLGNLRSLTREKLLAIRGVNIITADLLIGAFRKTFPSTSQVDSLPTS